VEEVEAEVEVCEFTRVYEKPVDETQIVVINNCREQLSTRAVQVWFKK